MAPVKKTKKLSSANHRPISATDANQQKKPLGSFVTFGNRRNLRVAMKKNKRILRKIWICSEVWMDTLPFFGRRQLGLKMALLSPRFNALVDKHFEGKSELPIWRPIRIDKIGTQAKVFVEKSNGKTVQFPMPKYPLPNKISFANLQIAYIDHSISTFLRANQQIFDKSGTNLDLFVPSADDDQPIWSAFARGIWPIFAPNIRHLNFSYHHHALENLRRHTSPTVLTDLNIISIHSDNLLPDSICDDGPNATAGQALTKWLNTPRSDGQPKQLMCNDYEHGHTSEATGWVNSFKDAFLRANISSASYIIRLEDFDESTPITPFELTNERTNEVLTLEKEDDFDCVLKRRQIGATDQWEDENPLDNLDKVNISLYGNCIGPLSPPKADKMNAKSIPKMNPGPSGQRKKK